MLSTVYSLMTLENNALVEMHKGSSFAHQLGVNKHSTVFMSG